MNRRPVPGLAGAGLLVGLVLAGPSTPPARAQGGGGGALDCGITVIQGGEPTIPEIASDGEERVIAFTSFPLPCGGPITATFVVELGIPPPLLGAEVRLRARAGCVDSVVEASEPGPACVVGTAIALEPQRFTLPVLAQIGLEPAGLDTRAVTFGANLERGRWVLVVDIEAIAGDVEVGKRFLHVLGGGGRSPRSGRVRDPGGFGFRGD